MTPYKLYGRQGSGSFAVQVALEETGAPYERIWIESGRVPVLVLPDGTSMSESAAMLIHVSNEHPTCGLAPPAATVQHALFLQWLVFLSSNVYESALRIYYSDRYATDGASHAAAVRDRATVDLFGHLELISATLRPFVLGDLRSIADVYLHMLASWFPSGSADLHARLPALGSHAQLMDSCPSVMRVQADHSGAM